MNAQSSPTMPRSAVVSLTAHGAVILLLLAATWWTHWRTDEKPVVFELVAGAGDNYAATEAPTTTAPSLAVNLPKPLPPRPKPVERQPEPPVPPKPTPPLPKPVEKKPEPVKIEKVPEKAPVKIEPVRERVTFDQFAAENGAPKSQPVRQPTPIKPKTIDVGRVTAATANNVTAGAGGTAMTVAETELSARYLALIRQRIQRALSEAGINDPRSADVRFRVSLAGEISDASIVRSSGSGAFDRAVLEAFRSIRPVGPPPTGKAQVFNITVELE